MNIQECYLRLGGDYGEVQRRIPSDALIDRFVKKFLADGSYAELCAAFEAGDRKAAFAAAHTLKGVTANLSFTKLCSSTSVLTERLRPDDAVIDAEALRLLDAVKADYAETTAAIREYAGL